MAYYSETKVGLPPKQLKFNGEYAFGFVATSDETEAGTVIVRGNMVGFSNRNTDEGKLGTAELAGTITLTKAAATVFTQGEAVFWLNGKVVKETAGAIPLGVVKFEPSINSETVEVIIGYVPRIPVE
jgi:predicted RecA/RadA family phage recombinase